MKELDNRGLSMVELVIAIAMSTIVIGAASLFLFNAERTYRTAEYSIDLQSEAQILMEQLANWVMESNWIAVEGTADDPVLVLYQINRPKLIDAGDHLELAAAPAQKRIIYISGAKLYMFTQHEGEDGIALGAFTDEIKDGTPDISDIPANPASTAPETCICEYLEALNGFKVSLPDGSDITTASKITTINVSVKMVEGVARQKQHYNVKNSFSIRNSIMDDVFEVETSEEGE